MVRISSLSVALATLALISFSCLPSTGDLIVVDDAPDRFVSDWPIINGLPPDAPEHQAVVSLHVLEYPNVYVAPFCSGTLIAEDVVITAAHCLDDAGGGGQFVTTPPENLAIYIGDEPAVDILDHLYFVTETLIHPSYDRLGLYNDIGLIRLETPAVEAAPVPHLPASEGFTSGDIGALINFAGFGDDENGASGVRLQVDGTLGGLGCDVPGCPDAGDVATMVSYEQNYTIGGPCFGDSGGPLFIDRAGTAYVGGLTSYGDANCAIYGVSTRADAFDAWITDFIADEPPACDYTGTVSSSNKNDYFGIGALSAGTPVTGDLSWDSSSANLDLYLQYYNGSRWRNSASSTNGTPGVAESISYTVPSNRDGLDFRWRVRRRSGTATYCLVDSFTPPPPPPNEPPTADAGGPYSAETGASITLDGSGSSDPDGTTVSYAWDFGDSTTGSGVSPSHSWAAAGSYVVTLTVTDDDGDSDVSPTTATVSDPLPNQPPDADAGGPYAADAGAPLTLDGSASSDPDGTIVSYAWDFGDGNTGSGVSPTHTYAAAGSYAVTLTVTDDDGATDVGQTTATISEPPPPPLCDLSGTVSSSNKNDYLSLGNVAQGTTLAATLTWEASGANVDLYLQWHNGSRWKTAARSTNSAPDVPESVSYTVPSNRDGAPFRWRVRRRSGTANYCLTLQ